MEFPGLQITGTDPGSVEVPAYTTAFVEVMEAVDAAMEQVDQRINMRWIGFLFAERGTDGKRRCQYKAARDSDVIKDWCFRITFAAPEFVHVVVVDRTRRTVAFYAHQEPVAVT